MADVWTIKAALDWTVGYLSRQGIGNPRLSAEWLLAEATGLRRIELYVNFEQPLSMAERAVLREYVNRRATGEPLQYITGEVGFRHIAVKVKPGVLIPRPETEVLVSEALRGFEADEEFLAADICTGSGCIACSVAYERPKSHVIACDISPEAVGLARENVGALGLGSQVDIYQGDLGDCVPSEYLEKLNLVVSNPPYIPTGQLATLDQEVAQYEPSLALDGGPDGNAIFRRLATWAFCALAPGGLFAVELHEDCLEDARSFAIDLGFSDVSIVLDLAGKPRVLLARRPN